MTDQLATLQAALSERYDIIAEIGRGGMSIVYLAHDAKYDRQVAVKVLRPELSASVGSERFLREIQIVARLQHPLIVPLYEAGEAAGQLYFVMPRIEGESLRSRLDREGQIPLADALQIGRDVAMGLSYAHGHGVIHRDIKPDNILLSGGHALISDFGIARAVADSEAVTSSGSVVGTTAYMSPEQAYGDARTDARSDIYALGCVLYEMLAGEHPFTGPTSHAILARKLEERPRSLRIVRPNVATTVEQAIVRALSPVAADRFTDAAQLAAALSDSNHPNGRHRGRWGARIATLVTAAIAITAGWLVISRAPPGSASTTAVAALDPTRIAVLYFEDLSADGKLRHVAHGLTEDLIDRLSGVSALHVISPSGVRPYSEVRVPLDSIVRALHVGTVVEGSIARPADRLRVTVRLINAATGEQLESRSLERPWGDLFTLEHELTDEVSRFLRQRLGREIQLQQQRAGTRSVTAWELVRRAAALREEAEALDRTGDRGRAERLLIQADSQLAAAQEQDRQWTTPLIDRGWLAVTQADLAPEDDPARESRWLESGMAAAQTALRRNPPDPRALELRGYLQFRRWRLRQSDTAATPYLDAAEQDLKAAVAAEPGLARAWNTLSLVYHQRGDFAAASLTLQKALQADAYLQDAARSIQLLFFSSLEGRDFSSAEQWCNTGQAQFPAFYGLWECRLVLLGWTGSRPSLAAQAWGLVQDVESRDSAKLTEQNWAFRRLMVAAVLARGGLADSARTVMRRTRLTAPNPAVLDGVELYEANVYVLIGEHQEALATLGSLLRAKPQMKSYIATSSWFTPLHDDPQFQHLVGTLPDPGAVQRLSP